MTLPKTILNIVKVIYDKLKISPKTDKEMLIEVKDFKDENGVVMRKLDLEKGLRKLAELKVVQVIDVACLYRYPEDYTGDRIKLGLNREQVEKFYKKHKQDILKSEKQISDEIKIEFIDSEPALKAGNKKCPLPPYRNEHYFCRVVFEYPADEAIDWSVITEKMDELGEDTKGAERNKRSLYDTVRAINKRVKEILGIDELFAWEENTIKRTR